MDKFRVDRLRTALALAILLCTVGVAAAARQPSSPHPHRRRVHPARRVPQVVLAAIGRLPLRTTHGIPSGRIVFLSEVRTSRSEVPTKSKDPYVPPISDGLGRNRARTPNRPRFRPPSPCIARARFRSPRKMRL